jgi:hypothetical protein
MRFPSRHAALSLLATLLLACSGSRPDAEGKGVPAPQAARPAADSVGVLVGAGDVAACNPDGAARTADLLDSIPGTVFVAGDAVYGSDEQPHAYEECYGTTWQRHKARTRPVLGNHDYLTTTPAQYFDYFGAAAGERPGGYYSYEVGPWHVVALNSNIDVRYNSPQERWLRDDLARHSGSCALAIAHHPRFSSGPHSGRERDLRAIWRDLEDAGATALLSGHDHLYERFTPMRGDGSPDSLHGVRQFVVGTGGAGHYPVRELDVGSEVRGVGVYGVLKLTLRPRSYSWEFVPVQGGEFRDSGSGSCRPLR